MPSALHLDFFAAAKPSRLGTARGKVTLLLSLDRRKFEEPAILLRAFLTALPDSLRRFEKAEDELLGTMTDRKLAKRLGCNESVVQVRRCKLGIRCHRHKWTPKADQLLGQMSDEAAARQIGCSVSAIKNRRFLLCIPQFEPGWKHWNAEEDQLLGTMPDSAVAKKLGRASGVRSRRLELGIPQNNPALRPWNAEELRLLGTTSDKVVAEKCGRTERGVRMKRFVLRIPAFSRIPTDTETDTKTDTKRIKNDRIGLSRFCLNSQ
jgi:hypothetical protein